MYTIRKKISFEMAHVLDDSYSNECKCLHGHSYKMEVFITSDILNKDGMVIDFKKLKEILHEKIIQIFDHSFVMNKYGKNPSAFKVIVKGLVFVNYNPTAENMCKDFYERIYNEIRKEVPAFLSLKVRLHETDTGYAEYSGE